ESLRTVLVWGDETPEQVVVAAPAVELPVVDLADVDELQQALRADTRRPFDLQRDPMLRATLFRLADDDHVLLLQPHHVAVDGWSVDLLYSEIAEVYEATRAGRPASLPDLPLQYRDFTRWQHDQLAGERLAEQL